MEKNSKNFVVLMILAISDVALSSSGGVPQNYKTVCSRPEDCETRKFLDCNFLSNTCDCPKGSVWDVETRQCSISEGRPCDLHRHGHKGHKVQYCVSNSSCVSSRCSCDDGYLKTGFGLCDLSYDSPCGYPDMPPCSWRYGLECPEGSLPNSERRCRCKGESVDYLWDETLQKCVSLIGSACDADSVISDDKLECVKGGHCVKERCECAPDHSPTPQRTCLLNYGELCDNRAKQFCNKYSFLNCQDNGKCGCEFYGQMVYDEIAGECRSLAGEFCDLPTAEDESGWDGRTHRCIRDAECTQSKHRGGKGKCTCTEGKLKTPDRNCTEAKGHGLPCIFAGDCNTKAFLTCIIEEDGGGTCDCIPNEMFNNGTDCLVLPGRSCSNNRICGRNSNCENGEFCICNPGYVLDHVNFTCYLPSTVTTTTEAVSVESAENEIIPEEFRNEDNDQDDCSKMPKDSKDFEMCDCAERTVTHVWVPEVERCLGLVGSPCDDDEDCVPFGFCDESELETKTCQCDVGKRTTLNRTCEPKTQFEQLKPTVMKAMSSSGFSEMVLIRYYFGSFITSVFVLLLAQFW